MIGEILTKIQDILAASGDIATYCAQKFDKEHQVWLGTNPQDPPFENGRPIAPIMVVSNIDGSERNDLQSAWQIQVRVGVSDEVIDRSGKKVSYRGFLRVIELSKIVEDVIILALGKVTVVTRVVPNEIWPLFSTIIVVTLEKNTPLRGVARRQA